MMPLSTPAKEKSRLSALSNSKVSRSASKATPKKARHTLSELSLNPDIGTDEKEDPMKDIYGKVDEQFTLRYSPELKLELKKAKINPKEHIKNNLNDALDHLEIQGWSKNGFIKSKFYDNLFTSDLKAKTLSLRGRGEWTTCCCPKATNKHGELIDTISPGRTTNLEQINIFRTFKITACALLDLISRSPKLRILRFYGTILTKDENHEDIHYEPFASVRFLSDLEAVYWPWCNVKAHKPTLRTLLTRNNQIQTLYTSSDIACDFINSDLLPNLKHLSLIMNEKWTCSPGKTKILKRYNRNINALRRADKIESLEVRTFDVHYQISDSDVDPDTHDLIKQNFETYQLQFWENVKDLPNLKFLAIYGAWELEEVTREMAKHGLQIEYFRTNLMPNSIITNLDETSDNTSKFLVLSMSDAAKHLAKLAKLKSLHFICHDNLSNIDEPTANAMRELSGLIWKFEIKVAFTSEVDKLTLNILKRGIQNGCSYKVRFLITPEDATYANMFEVAQVDKLIDNGRDSLRDMFTEFAQTKVRQRFGKVSFKTFLLWGIEQDERGRDKTTYNQLKAKWDFYEQLFRPLDMFI